jgi:hypothetical protein
MIGSLSIRRLRVRSCDDTIRVRRNPKRSLTCWLLRRVITRLTDQVPYAPRNLVPFGSNSEQHL